MKNNFNELHFSNTLLNWFSSNKRELPWRNTKEPYKIWLSEIILQQTRVAQGLPYYEKFIKNYPDIQLLANAPIDNVLRDWQGLGYYSRARNMHNTAKIIVEHLNGEFPNTYKELIKLKGIGPYTAAAISSFTTNEAVAVVDGNVYRVLARYYGLETDISSSIGKKQFQELASSLIPKNQPGNYNQAIMEFGAIQCTPKNPTCLTCPLASTCVAFAENKVYALPFKSKKVTVKERFLYYFLPDLKLGNKLMMRVRGKGDIWEGLYDFPSIEAISTFQEIELINKVAEKFELLNNTENQVFESYISGYSKEYQHKLTHQKLFIRFLVVTESFLPRFEAWCLKNDYLAYSFKETNSLPKPIIIANYLDQFNG